MNAHTLWYESLKDSGCFVAGTDTNVGKTVLSAFLVEALDADYFKPIQTGTEMDRPWVQARTQLPIDRFHPECYALKEPASPHLAARLEGRYIELDKIALPSTTRPLVVEGAGGLFVPINDQVLLIDLIEKLGLPVVLVARSALGTINHTLLSLAALRSRGIEPHCVVVSGKPNPANVQAIEQYGRVRAIPFYQEL